MTSSAAPSRPLAALAAGLCLVTACGGGGGSPDAGGGGGIGGTGGGLPGTLRVSLTDAPACGFDAVNVTVERVRVHVAGSAGEGDTGWHDIVVSPARRLDLLQYTNGATAPLGELTLPSGRYTQMRLVLAANGGGAPFANSVVPTGGTEVALTTPSAQRSGIKLDTAIDVPAGQVADVVLDFDACKSVVRRGNSGQYNLKPVISVIPVLSGAGLRVSGFVPPEVGRNATVSVQFQGRPVKATVPDATGKFVLYPVPAGTYDLVAAAAGRVTTVVTGVPVTPAAATVVNTAAAPLPLQPSSVRTVAGAVSPATGSVRALQTLGGAPAVEAAWAPVDPATGSFRFDVPLGAPLRAAHGPALSFTADAPAAGRHVVEAESDGVRRSQPVDATAPVAPLTFTFP